MAALALSMAGVIAGTGLVAPAAQAQSFDGDRIITSFDIGTLRAALEELGATITAKDSGGYLIKFANGTASSVYLTACGSGPCLGTHLKGSFGSPSDKSVVTVERIVTEFNKNMRPIKVYNRGSGRSMAEMYIISDGGITMENYKRQLSLYAFTLQKFREALYTDG